uniref:C-type lectin domain family 4 member F-like n=1 Tax=Styela clava TaxID=7725 RepID=UPI00193A3EAE|nr:C-type lectin domain family 4 member F-like [Styela clava]
MIMPRRRKSYKSNGYKHGCCFESDNYQLREKLLITGIIILIAGIILINLYIRNLLTHRDEKERVKKLEVMIKDQNQILIETKERFETITKQASDNSTTLKINSAKENTGQQANMEVLQTQYNLKIVEMQRRIQSTELKITDAISLMNSSKKSKVEKTMYESQTRSWYLATNNMLYKFFRIMVTYDEASEKCKILGSRLASELSNNDSRRELQSNVLDGTTKNVWIGLPDSAHEGSWIRSDGTPPKWNNTDWNKNDSNNNQRNGSCAIMGNTLIWKMVHISCTNRFSFLCEKD